MTDNTTINTRQVSGWELLAEFSTTSSPGGDRQLSDQVVEAIEALGLAHQQLERIQKAVLQAVQGCALPERPAGPIAQVQIRIWVAGECAYGRGWGFFLVEKRSSEREGENVKTDSLVDLFLYQEPEP